MNLNSVANDFQHQTNYRLEQRFLQLMRSNPHYRNLSESNRDLILDLLKKYKEKKRQGIKISDLAVRRDMYTIYHDRIALGLTKHDLDQIKDLLSELKS